MENLRTEILKTLVIYGVFWKNNGKTSLPPFVRSQLVHVIEDAMR